MPSFADSIFLFLLALLLFGPKKLPVLARELGKWMGEFRRASNEFKMQMEEELRASEQGERQKQIAAMESAAPIPPPLEEPEVHPHLRQASLTTEEPTSYAAEALGQTPTETVPSDLIPVPLPEPLEEPVATSLQEPEPMVAQTADGSRPIPIASSGNLHMMPPPTGLPTARGRAAVSGNSALGGLVDAIPTVVQDAVSEHQASVEEGSRAHGD